MFDCKRKLYFGGAECKFATRESKTNFLSEDFSKPLKRSLAFRARLVVGPFLLKMDFEFYFSHDNLQDNIYEQDGSLMLPE